MASIPLYLKDQLNDQVNTTAQRLALSRQETIRQALRLGLPALLNKWPEPDEPELPLGRTKRKGGAK